MSVPLVSATAGLRGGRLESLVPWTGQRLRLRHVPSPLSLSLSQVFFSSFSFHVQDRGRVEGGYGGRESFSPLGRLRASLLGRSAPLHHTLGGAWRFSWPAGCFSVVGEPPLRALVLTSLGMNQCGLTERQGTERLASTADDRMQIVTRD